MTGLTAHIGLLDVGQPQPGDTILVSGAAGSVGSFVIQIAQLKGFRVVAIAGGDRKCDWLRNELGADATIDYKGEDVDARLRELCSDGVDVFFDNVGGEILDAVLEQIAIGARIVLCGAISGYNDFEHRPGIRNHYRLIIRRATMRGFLVFDHMDRGSGGHRRPGHLGGRGEAEEPGRHRRRARERSRRAQPPLHGREPRQAARQDRLGVAPPRAGATMPLPSERGSAANPAQDVCLGR